MKLRQVEAELERLKVQLAEQSSWTNAMFNSLGEGLIAADARGRIIKVNPYAGDVLGYEPDELIGHWFTGIVEAVDEAGRELEPLERPVVRAVTTGQVVAESIYYRRRDASLVPVFVTVSPILIDGLPAGTIEVFRDLTEERRLDIAKDEFVSLASHQLRTPSTGVKSILSMLLSGDFGDLAPQQSKYLRRAAEANDRQLQIIEDMLSVAKIDAGRMEYRDDTFDLAGLLRGAVSDQAAAIADRDQSIELESPKTCPITADEAKLRMVIDNLISNASKYTKPGGSIRVGLTAMAQCVVLKIADTGVGIPPAQISQLFKKFSRLDNELSFEVGGNGLGLFMAKSIVELHGGTITVSSELGEGSEFAVVLPIRSKS